jgi:RNA polymerase primary sigma factor
MLVKRKERQQDALRSYFDQIKKTPLLTAEEERQLSKRIQKGNQQALKQLVEANLRLVVKIAKVFMTSDVSLLDLIQEGNLGLMRAASKFDYRKNVRFSTYASWWIKQSIVRSLSNKRRAIRLPHRKEELLRKINKAANALSQSLMREPTVDELASEVGVDPSDINGLMNMSYNVVSLDGDSADDSGSLKDVFEDYSYDPGAELMRKSLREDTLRSLSMLPDKEREIILYRYSFHGGKKWTLKTIGDKMGISPETVRQIEIRALKRLGETASDLRAYVYN